MFKKNSRFISKKELSRWAEHDDGGVSEEFKKKVEEVCDRLAPKNKENNALWKLVSEICKDDVKE
ncbi:hypothetical protein M3181_08365 [Mesobacillus maritimus]|uniref:hypothetical protein n=1 Tax=Mesobacillus maritimus TaxID=1643336 RepID=UPI00203EC5BD|nr:hypothetical protein [Mesobacillus maritimus]MCM3669014.1 hypothetical protein [Mesobacillus maritimus]